MLNDLRQLLQHVSDASAAHEDFARAVLQDNCLGKRSSRSRAITLRHLMSLYALEQSIPLYRAMRYFWQRDSEAQPLLACLIAYGRDPILRLSAPFVLRMSLGASFVRTELEDFLDSQEKGRFSKATLKSTAQNLATTWTHSGHLKGRVRKSRSVAVATPGSVALALFLGYVTGARAQALFETEYTRLLDCSTDRALELAETASRRGWIVCKRIGTVIEVLFPNLLTPQEQEWVREQS